MEKANGRTANVSSKINKELEKAKYRITCSYFPIMFHIAEQLLYFEIFWEIFNDSKENIVFVCKFPGKLSLFTMT